MIDEAPANPPADSPRCAAVRLRAIPGAGEGPVEDATPEVAPIEGEIGVGGARIAAGKRVGFRVYVPSGAENASGGRVG